ncbi:hypothetical protein SAMN05880501_113111 [Ureibacillus xyleni]|uniref:Uncharacterized protein n=1 Tax=Ureibacillus xyleni TaxID=614648 RepID=A0A285TMM5_9BACL|nr:hypothetical protein [Ureibacillus xyleni]SOC22021.1 hypothetical protein SAMN05880501_113111 [Ureibacillus xyleni]
MTIENLEQAQQVANEIAQLEATIKLMKDSLKSFVDVYGVVQAGGVEWGYKESVSWKIEPDHMKEFMQWVALEGLNPFEMMTVSATSLKKLAWPEDTLTRIASKKATKSFRSTKI